jgi:hypothetical protein
MRVIQAAEEVEKAVAEARDRTEEEKRKLMLRATELQRVSEELAFKRTEAVRRFKETDTRARGLPLNRVVHSNTG